MGFHPHPLRRQGMALAFPHQGGRDFNPAFIDTLGISYPCQPVKGEGICEIVFSRQGREISDAAVYSHANLNARRDSNLLFMSLWMIRLKGE